MLGCPKGVIYRAWGDHVMVRSWGHHHDAVLPVPDAVRGR